MTRFLNQPHTAQLSGVLYIIEHYYKLYNQPQKNLLHDISRIKVNEFKINEVKFISTITKFNYFKY